MSSSLAVYQVVITNGNSNSTPKDGFVDNLRIEDYAQVLTTTPASLTYNLSKAKRRANLRYHDIVNQLSRVCNVSIQVVLSDATYHAEATTFTFYMTVEAGDAALNTNDESNPGDFLTSTNCIKRCVARALTNHMFRQTDVFDPTNATSTGVYGGTTSVIRVGTRILDSAFEVGVYSATLVNAESLIAVTPVSLSF
jgi:hypothetical protein